MTKKKALLNERVIRRWGKLANMAPLTENWLEEQDAESADDEMAAAEDEVAAGEAEMEAGEEAEGEQEADPAAEVAQVGGLRVRCAGAAPRKGAECERVSYE